MCNFYWSLCYLCTSTRNYSSWNVKQTWKGKDDIFSFHIPDIHFSLHVYVTNKVTNEPIPGVSVLVKGSDGSEVVKTTDAEGKVKLESENKKQFINKETSYNIEVAKDEYLIAKNQISTVGQEKSKRFISFDLE